MMRRLMVCALVCAPAVLLAQAALNNFARGIEIQTDASGGIFRIVLPEDVYATVTRPDLSDVRVFNAAGDSVPHTLREAPLPTAADAVPVEVPSFPIYQTAAEVGALTQVRIGERGTVLEVRRDPAEGETIAAYLVDASALQTPLDGISLDVEGNDSTSFLTRLEIQGSDDLSRWRTIVPAAAIARMQHGAYMLTQSDVELPPMRSRYLRISWPKELAAMTLRSVRVRPVSARPVAEIRWTTFAGQKVSDSAGSVVYDTRARLPIEQVDLEFADPTDAASVTVRSRPDTSSEWRRVHSGLFYSLTESGAKVGSSPAHIARTTDRYWILETSREGGWKQDRLPRLKLGWIPHELLFLGQGTGPYTLVYGSARVGPSDAPVDAVLASLGRTYGTDRTRVATLGATRDIGGAEALRPVPPWRRFILWAVLIAAVITLGGFALRVFRDPIQMTDDNSQVDK